ncbi:MFS transporter [Saccharopolyspora rosea]|uniref:MFS transporter n=1 Tax=Saccharopolyspora rosea TaxID=524884 RepID=A0ABW3FU79_9PSEU
MHFPERTFRNPATKAGIGGFVGTTIEWYDFYLYGTATALVFDRLFFPAGNPTASTLAAFATFAAGFGARPVGALVSGHLGDRVGRKPMLVASLLMMGFATLAIGFLPTYVHIGLAAPALLVAVRLLQGLAAGAEWGGAALLAVEHAKPGRRGWYGSMVQVGSPTGMLLASGGFATVRLLVGDSAFDAWGWRVPFLVSIVLIALGLVIRVKLDDGEIFARARDQQELARWPLLEVVRTQQKNLWLTAGMRLSQNGGYSIYTTFGLTYVAQHFGTHNDLGLTAILISSAVGLVSTPAWAALSDRVGRRPLYLFGAIGGGLFLPAHFLAVNSGSPVLVVLAVVIGINVFQDAMYGPQAAWFSELFGTKVRYSGASIGYQFGSVVSGGLAPLIAAALLVAGGGSPWLIVLFFAGLSALTAVSAYLAAETYRLPSLDGGTLRPVAATT